MGPDWLVLIGVAIIMAGILAVLWLTAYLSEVVIPLIVALLLAALLQPVHQLLSRVVPRGLAAGLTVLGTLAVVSGMLSFVGSQLTSQLDDITTKARNVGGYAPGELNEMVTQGSAVRVPIADYRKWLDGYAPGLRAKILQDWGDPEKTTLMATAAPAASGSSAPSLVIPVVRYGNVILLPQPSRGWGEDAEKMYHAKDLAPHHQYVATYAWLRNGFKADAVVHVGTHGTLEWLDGKDIGLNEEDAPDALIADLPDIYIYNVDVVGEGLVARRRGMATLVDHMVPPFKKGGLYPELAALSEAINDYDVNIEKNPELANACAFGCAR